MDHKAHGMAGGRAILHFGGKSGRGSSKAEHDRALPLLPVFGPGGPPMKLWQA